MTESGSTGPTSVETPSSLDGGVWTHLATRDPGVGSDRQVSGRDRCYRGSSDTPTWERPSDLGGEDLKLRRRDFPTPLKPTFPQPPPVPRRPPHPSLTTPSYLASDPDHPLAWSAGVFTSGATFHRLGRGPASLTTLRPAGLPAALLLSCVPLLPLRLGGAPRPGAGGARDSGPPRGAHERAQERPRPPFDPGAHRAQPAHSDTTLDEVTPADAHPPAPLPPPGASRRPQ